MSVSADQPTADIPSVQGVLNYLAPDSPRPVNYTFEPPAGTPVRNAKVEARTVAIHDARTLPRPPSLDVEGFALVPHRTDIDFTSDADVRARYYPEVEALIRKETGAVKVVIFDHTLRSASAERRSGIGAREPVRSVHNDYTVTSGVRRVVDHLPPDEAQARLHRRHAIINVWRSLGREIVEAPLALCDARTIEARDWVAGDLVYPDRVGETYAVHYNPAHRWYYYPRLQGDEAILLKTYDSAEDGRARFSAHTAFDDPTSPANPTPRESIEVRALVFFDEDLPHPVHEAAPYLKRAA